MLIFRTMAYADYEYPSSAPQNVKVLYDTEENKVISFQLEDDDTYWNAPSKSEVFFPTLEEATKEMDAYRQSLIDKMPEVKKYLRTMENFDKDDKLYPKREEYLPFSLVDMIEQAYYKEKTKRLEEVLYYLCDYIHTGYLSLNGISFKPDDIEYVEWHKGKAKLVMKNGTIIFTDTRTEKQVVEVVFGENNSRKEY